MKSPRNNEWENGLKARQIKAAEWEQHKESIRWLYLNCGVKIQDVRKELWIRYGFYATETQYKKRLRIFRMEKNISKQKMSAIIQISDRRQAVEGKLTFFAWHGKLVEAEKIERSRRRYGFTTGYRLSGPLVDTPSSVTYWTPKIFTPIGSSPWNSLGLASNSQWTGIAIEQACSPMDVVFDERESIELAQGMDMSESKSDDWIEQVCSEGFMAAPQKRTLMQPVEIPSDGTTIQQLNAAMNDPIGSHYFPAVTPATAGDEFDSEIDKLLLEADQYWTEHGLYESTAQDNSRSLDEGDSEMMSLLHRIGIAYYEMGNLEQAIRAFESAFDGRVRLLGEDNVDTLESLHNLGLACYQHGRAGQSHQQRLRCRDALKWFEYAFSAREQLLGELHPDTLETLHYLGATLRKVEQYQRAQECLERALAGREQILSKTHPQTVDTLHELGCTFYHRQEYKKARQFLEETLELRVKDLGEDNAATLTTLHYLGITYCQSYDSKKGEECLQRAYAGRVRVLGEHHQETMETYRRMHGMAVNFRLGGTARLADDVWSSLVAF